MKSLGKIIKEKRIEKSLSPLNLANMLDVDLEDVLRWEEGTSEPSVDVLKRLALVFSISIEAFFKEEKSKESHQLGNALTCLWCGEPFGEEDLFQKDPYSICLGCENEKRSKINSFNEVLILEGDKVRKLTRKYSKNTVWINLFMIIVLFLTISPFLNSFNEYRELIFLGGLYFVVSFVSYVTLLHFKGFIYKYSQLLIKKSMNFPKKLFNAKIKGVIWTLFIKVIFGIILIVLSAVLILVGSLGLIVLSPFFLPITLIKYRRSVNYDYL